MSTCHVPTRALLLCLPFAALAASAAGVSRTENRDAAIMAAEVALQRNDCRTASQGYLAAVRGSSDLKLLEHAADVTLDCAQFQIAEQVAARWRVVAPDEALSWLTAVQAQLGRARLADARARLLAWFNARPAPEDASIAGAIDWLVEHSGTDMTLALLRDVRHKSMTGVAVQLRMAQLASAGWDFALALKYADAAAKAGADMAAVRMVQMRAQAGLGNADAALAAAHALVASDDSQVLAVPETLLWLGRDAEAEQALLDVRGTQQLRLLADRRLALLAFSRSDYALAQERFTALLRDQGTAAMAVYYLGIIAERRGAPEEALRGYELLANSAFDGAARRRVAGIYFHDGEHVQALRMLAATDGADVITRIGAELSIADFLAAQGAAADGVARLDAALQSYPDHPDINYQRAVLLERSDSDAAITVLESLVRERPADMNVANALGFTLADHNKDLARAERLIQRSLRGAPDNPAVLDSLGWVYYRRGQTAAALPVLQRAFRLFHDGDIGAHLGEVLWQLGRHDEARALWQQALGADPENANLAATARHFVPELVAPKPPATLGNGPGTSI